MAGLRWTSALAVGVPEIDRQHSHLLDLMARLHDLVVGGGDRAVLSAVMEELERYTEFHFATEERLMDAHGYEDADDHKDEHSLMLDDIHRCCDEYILASNNPKPVLAYLEHWFVQHIHEVDRALGKALNAAD